MAYFNKERNKFKKNFLKSKELQNSATLPELPAVSLLKISENQTVKTRVLSELADFKLGKDKKVGKRLRKSVKSDLKDTSDHSNLLSTLGVISSPSNRKLPKDISKLKEILSSSKTLDKLELGSPATREDTTILSEWLDSMLKTALSESNNNIENLCETAMLIYEVCFHEIVRQVSVQCLERGDLINRVWKAYLGILEKALKISKAIQSRQVSEFQTDLNNLAQGYKDQIQELKSHQKFSSEEINKIKRQLKNKEDEINKIAKKEVKIIEKMNLIQKEYESNKRELLFIQEDNRILNAKLMNCNIEFVEGTNGVIQPRLVSIQKFKRKDSLKIQKIIDSDPLLSAQMTSDEKTKNLLKSIESYKKFTGRYITQPDFCDQSCGTETIYADSQVQTDSYELKTSRAESIKLSEAKLIEFKLENILDLSQDQSIEKVSADPGATASEKTEGFLVKFQEKIDQVNALIEKMKQNMQNKIPIVSQKELLKTFYSSVKDSVSMMQQEYQNVLTPEPFERSQKRNKLFTFIQKTKVSKKPTVDLISSLTQKVINTPLHKLKNIIVKKTLLKTINIIYDIKIKKISEGDKKQDIGQVLTEFFYYKYGMPKVVENKFFQLLGSCVKYKSIKRVFVFGRFLKLFKVATMDDLNFYLDSFSYMKQPSTSENIEELRIPYEKIMEWYKLYLPSIFTEQDRTKMKVFIESYKQLDPATKLAYIDLDSVLEYGIDILQKKRSDNLDFLKSIYEAGDVIII